MFRELPPQAVKETYYTLPFRTAVDRLAFPVGKKYTDSYTGAGGSCSEWDEVGDGIFLGAIPYELQCDALIEFVSSEQDKNPDQKKRPLKLIISVVDYFELGGSFALPHRIATPKDWSARGVKQCSLPIKDFGAVAFDECIIKAIYEMRECLMEGNSVYVHCKAGRGRSAMLCAIYLAVFDEVYAKLTVEEAFLKAMEQMRGKRTQVKLDNLKSDKAKQVIQHIRNLTALKKQEDEDYFPENIFEVAEVNKEVTQKAYNKEELIDNYLASPAGKIALTEMVFFKELAIYGAFHEPVVIGESSRCTLVRSFFDEMYSATDAKWYRDYHKADSFTQLLLDAEPLSGWIPNIGLSFFGIGPTRKQLVREDRELREELVSKFFGEVTYHLSSHLGFDIETLNNLGMSKKDETVLSMLLSSSVPSM